MQRSSLRSVSNSLSMRVMTAEHEQRWLARQNKEGRIRRLKRNSKPEIALVPALKRAAYAERFGLSEVGRRHHRRHCHACRSAAAVRVRTSKESATQNGEAPPAEPLLSLSPDERKRIRVLHAMAPSARRRCFARTEFDEHSQRDPDSLLCLPHPFESLRSQDVASPNFYGRRQKQDTEPPVGVSGVRSDGTPSPEAACHEAAKQGAEGTGQAGTGPTDRGVLATSESPNRLRGRLTEHMISYVSGGTRCFSSRMFDSDAVVSGLSGLS